MIGYIKYFDDGGKNMSFVTDEYNEKYNKIWEAVRKLLKLKFTISSVGDDKCIIARLKIFKNINMTTFTNNTIPEENTHYTCISAIDIDSVLKIDKKAFPQAYLEQYKYKLKKRKRSRYIDHLKIIDYDSGNDSSSDDFLNDLDNFKNDFIVLVIIKKYKYFWCDYHGRIYNLIKHVRSSAFIDCKCFSCLISIK